MLLGCFRVMRKRNGRGKMMNDGDGSEMNNGAVFNISRRSSKH